MNTPTMNGGPRTCYRCHLMCDDEGYVALRDGRNFHQHCYICDLCYLALPLKYANKNERFYHVECYSNAKATSPRCTQCNDPVLPSEVQIQIETWQVLVHRRCYVCEVCSLPLSDLPEVGMVNGQPKLIHKECFFCSVCQDSLHHHVIGELQKGRLACTNCSGDTRSQPQAFQQALQPHHIRSPSFTTTGPTQYMVAQTPSSTAAVLPNTIQQPSQGVGYTASAAPAVKQPLSAANSASPSPALGQRRFGSLKSNLNQVSMDSLVDQHHHQPQPQPQQQVQSDSMRAKTPLAASGRQGSFSNLSLRSAPLKQAPPPPVPPATSNGKPAEGEVPYDPQLDAIDSLISNLQAQLDSDIYEATVEKKPPPEPVPSPNPPVVEAKTQAESQEQQPISSTHSSQNDLMSAIRNSSPKNLKSTPQSKEVKSTTNAFNLAPVAGLPISQAVPRKVPLVDQPTAANAKDVRATADHVSDAIKSRRKQVGKSVTQVADEDWE